MNLHFLQVISRPFDLDRVSACLRIRICQIATYCLGILFVSIPISLPAHVVAQDEFLDLLEMKSGNSIRVELKDQSKDRGGTFAIVKTKSGGTLKLQKGRTYKRIKPTDEITREYREILAKMKDSPDDHWRVYNWLSRQKNSKSRFKAERQYHLERIVAKDSRDTKALKLLKYVEIDGQWVPGELVQIFHGYVSKGGKWYSKRQIAMKEQADSYEEAFGDKRKALSRWKKYVLSQENANSASNKLFEIVDNSLIPEVMRLFKREKNPRIRRLYVDAIGQIPSSLANSTLITIAITDEHQDVSERAMVLCKQEFFSPFVSVTKAARYLNSPNNFHIRRAGELIGILAADNAPYYLLNALVTNHKIKTGSEPGRTKVGMVDGNINQFGVGGDGPAEKIVEFRNGSVLDAIRRITGEDFGYNEPRWKQWYIENYTVQEDDLMRDD